VIAGIERNNHDVTQSSKHTRRWSSNSQLLRQPSNNSFSVVVVDVVAVVAFSRHTIAANARPESSYRRALLLPSVIVISVDVATPHTEAFQRSTELLDSRPPRRRAGTIVQNGVNARCAALKPANPLNRRCINTSNRCSATIKVLSHPIRSGRGTPPLSRPMRSRCGAVRCRAAPDPLRQNVDASGSFAPRTILCYRMIEEDRFCSPLAVWSTSPRY